MRPRSIPAKQFIEEKGEYNPGEITEDDHKKYEQEREQAEQGTFCSIDVNKSIAGNTSVSKIVSSYAYK